MVLFVYLFMFSVMRRRARVDFMCTMSHHCHFKEMASYVYGVPQRGCIISV